jgi:tetratricopeptide (TPR) repeat protein
MVLVVAVVGFAPELLRAQQDPDQYADAERALRSALEDTQAAVESLSEAFGPASTEAAEYAEAQAAVLRLSGALGQMLERQGNYAEAIEVYQQAGNQEAEARAREMQAMIEDSLGAADADDRVARENARIAAENARIRAENEQIRQMEEERRRLEAELREVGGNPPPR